MTKLWAMRGWPSSGKSTLARKLATEADAVVVNRDLLRLQLLGSYWTGKREDEDRVTIAEEAQVKSFLQAGVSVVVDAQHVNPQYLRKWAKLAGQLNVGFEVVDVRTDVEECVLRDLRRMENDERYVGEKVIRDQAKRFPMEKWPKVVERPRLEIEPVERDRKLPQAIIVDIDGTLAHMSGRSPYNYDLVHTDVRDEQTCWLVRVLYDLRFMGHGPAVLIVSGRDDSCREATAEWLKANGVYYDELHMRPADAKDPATGNKLPDYLVKYDLFNANIRGKYDVRFVLDDRNQVVDLWRAMGLKCLQVQPGDF